VLILAGNKINTKCKRRGGGLFSHITYLCVNKFCSQQVAPDGVNKERPEVCLNYPMGLHMCRPKGRAVDPSMIKKVR